MKLAILFAVALAGCGGRVFDENGTGNGGLSGADAGTVEDTATTPIDSGPSAPIDPGPSAPIDSGPSAPIDIDAGPAAPPIAPSEIWYVEVHETAPSFNNTIRVNSKCIVTDQTGRNQLADAARCKELFEVAVDPTSYGCGPGGGSGTVTIRLHDGREFVRDLAADRCSVLVPSVRAHKFVYAVWYSVGGK